MRSGSSLALAILLALSAVTTTSMVAKAADALPYLKQVVIGRPQVPDSIPSVCPLDSFPVHLIGELPDNCTTLAGVELVYLPTFGFAAAPPIVRIKYTSGDCLGRPCIADPIPWERVLWLTGLPPGSYQLPLEAWRVDDVCPIPGDSLLLASIQRPFTVAEACSANAVLCLDPGWKISSDRGDRCDAFLGSGAAAVTLKLGTGVPLAGLEGEIRLQPAGLEIVDIEPIGPAAGMHLGWQRVAGGADFVMFAKDGAPIPGGTLPPAERVPILRVHLASGDAAVVPPLRTVVTVGRLLGATKDGRGVPRCPTPAVIEPDDYAVVCAGPACDFDRNGVTDVRDLVRMVRCIRNEGPCPDTTRGQFDCNHDGAFDIDDVFCCARAILRDPHEGPGDGTRDDSIQLTLGAPEADGDVFRVPLRLDSDTPLGGARIALRFPADRFDVVSLEASDTFRHSWLMLYEVEGDEIVIGLLAMGSAGVPPAPDLTLRLKPGQTAAGSLTLLDGEFSDGNGDALITQLRSQSIALGAGELSLSPASPNPFRSSVTFSVVLPGASDLEVGVFDLSGRRVTTLHRGTAAAGSHEFHWNGTDANGQQVRGGVYFVRARAAGELISRRAVFLGGR